MRRGQGSCAGSARFSWYDLEAEWYETRQRAAREARDAALSRAMQEYADELRYLGIDLEPWKAEDGPFPTATRDLVGRLTEALEEYRATRAEESERSEARRDLEAAVLGIFGEWEMLPRPDARAGADDDEAESGGEEEASGEDAARRGAGELVEGAPRPPGDGGGARRPAPGERGVGGRSRAATRRERVAASGQAATRR